MMMKSFGIKTLDICFNNSSQLKLIMEIITESNNTKIYFSNSNKIELFKKVKSGLCR